jgi:hypothetical protein
MTSTARVSFGVLNIAIVLLAVATALIHIALAIPTNLILFYLNGLGYLGLTAALYLPQFRAYRQLVHYALIAFTAVTVLGWAVVGERSTIAYIDKAIEVALVVLLVVSLRRGVQ